jgi:hypothetical protein
MSLRLAPFLTELGVSSLPLWLTWFWFTGRSLLQLTLSLLNITKLNTELLNCLLNSLTTEWIPNHDWTPLNWLSNQSPSYFTTDGLSPISSSWRQIPSDPGPEFYSQMNTRGHSSYIISSLTTGWVCHLQLVLALARAFILGSESRGTREHILLSPIQDCRLLRLAGLHFQFKTPGDGIFLSNAF